ncbi:DUF4124 domain-containing protein [Stutzerimonas stutzeri]|uniref:DUF4124 domain-containing protein n=1 Tax=Stutzerimonas sp. S1 TaxID=3030652 RepID=UPI002224E926|nr:DUF4124 domain-containing protein [Stutzerimonas sp. S1]MCW3150131.1 DUF4124 domain-containing protein [Stutzerimonas sp. S1]
MHQYLAVTLFTSALMASQASIASTVFRCTDSDGQVTFSQQGCPDGTDRQRQQAYNPTPSTGKATKMASTKPRETRKAKHPNEERLTIVAERHDGCGNRVTGSDRRSAIIAQRILAGMTRADVESALGRPDNVASSNGRVRYRYTDNDGGTRTITFDEGGCVTGKR